MFVVEALNAYVFGPAMLFAIFGTGLFFLVRTRFFCFVHPAAMMRVWLGRGMGRSADGVSPFSALCTALAGTLGVGNIVGVSTALAAGGAGAVFWMWISAVTAMVLKYAEVVLGMLRREKCRDGWHGGAVYYIRHALGTSAARFFAVCCVAASFTLGNAVQCRAVADAARVTFGISPWLTGGVIALICFAVIAGGLKSVSAFTLRAIPLLTLLFLVMSAASICAGADKIPAVMRDICSSAFTPSSAAGGIGGFLLSRSLRFGIARGIASNEAGCGTAPTAHAASSGTSPAEQGFWGILEVFVDTILLCTLTALVILINGTQGEGVGMAPVVAGFAALWGRAAGWAVCLSVFFFALATVICWSYYGTEALRFLSPRRGYKRAYIFLFCAACLPFSAMETEAVWAFSDLIIGVMTVFNTGVLLSRSGEIARVTREYFTQYKG